MGRKQSEKRRTVRLTLVFMAAALLTLSGCAGNSGGTVYLSAVSRLKLEISGDGMVREVEALNKAGSALLGDSAFDNRTSTETLDALIPLMQTEDADTVFVDVFSDDKNVRQAWSEYYHALCVKDSDEIQLKQMQQAQDKLLEKMAISLGYKDKITWEA